MDKKGTVLIVDDEHGMRETLTDVFEHEGYSALCAEDGHKGIEMAQKELVDVVLLDIVMPGIDGVETLKRLKAMNPSIKVIMMTGHADGNLVDEAMAAGVKVLSKPFDLKMLLNLVSEEMTK